MDENSVFINDDTGELYDDSSFNPDVDLFSAAQAAMTDCPLFIGRTQLKTEDIIDKELTIIAFDFATKRKDEKDENGNVKKVEIINPITGKPEKYGVCVFAEYPTNYYSSGTVGTKLYNTLCAATKGTPEKTSAILAAQGGIVVKFYKPAGKRYFSIDVIRKGDYKG